MKDVVETIAMGIFILFIIMCLIAGSALTLVFGAIAAGYALIVLTVTQKEFWYFMASIVLVYGLIKLI